MIVVMVVVVATRETLASKWEQRGAGKKTKGKKAGKESNEGRLSRSSNGYFKPLLDPSGGFTSETAARRFRKEGGGGLKTNRPVVEVVFTSIVRIAGASPVSVPVSVAGRRWMVGTEGK
jgi:hypothetical protein